MAFKLRPFQERALQQYRAVWADAYKALGIAPTAFGKTILMGWLADKLVKSENYRVIIISHREALVRQNAEKVSMVAPSLRVGMERAEHRAESDDDVISASIATLRGKRMRECVSRWKSDGRKIFLFTDEAHHALAPSYLNFIDELAPERHLGVTATPFRADGQSLAEVFPETAFEIPRSEMIDDGWLADPQHFVVKTAESLEGMKKKKGDYDERELVERLAVSSRDDLIINASRQAQTILEQELGQPVTRGVVFALSVEHAHSLADRFANELKWNAIPIDANTPISERIAADELLKTSDRHTVLLSYGVLTEGWDVEQVNLGLFARPTKSGVLADQMLGRLLRYMESKPKVLAIDFEDQGSEDRVSIASTFRLPPRWDCVGASLRDDERWFEEQYNRAPYKIRGMLWSAETRPEVERILEQHQSLDVEPLPDRPYLWWDCGKEIRMIMDTASLVIHERAQGDVALEYRWGQNLEEIGRFDLVDKALEAGEGWLNTNCPDQEMFLRNWPDRGEPITEKQEGFLAKRFNPDDVRQLTKRKASLLINQTFMENNQMTEQGKCGFGKHRGQMVSELPSHYMDFMLKSRRDWLTSARRPELTMFESELVARGYY